MLLNLLVRLERVVDRVIVTCPSGLVLQLNVIPFVDGTADLAGSLQGAADTIGIVPVTVTNELDGGAVTTHIAVGPGPARPGSIRVHGEGWCGGITVGDLPDTPLESRLAFGPFVAACLAAGDVFRIVRGDPVRYVRPDHVFYSAFDHTVTDAWNPAGPVSLAGTSLDLSVAGMGAVGCAWLHAIWSCADLTGEVVAADPQDVDESNLNRCVLFTIGDIDQPKVDVVGARLPTERLTVTPHVGPIEEAPRRSGFLIGAVDEPEARTSVQAILPFPLLFATTKDLRAEVVRCDPTWDGPCMACHGRFDRGPSDVDMAERFLDAPEDEQERLAAAADTTRADALRWAEDPTGQCGTVGERVLTTLKEADDEDRALFSVPFVSVMGGVLLAAETVKEIRGLEPLSGTAPRAVFQFLRPRAATNGKGAYLRDLSCSVCRPDRPAGERWRQIASMNNPRPGQPDQVTV